MRGLIDIALGLFFIWGGLSGRFTIVFVDSPMGLALIGLLLVAWGAYRMISSRQQDEPT